MSSSSSSSGGFEFTNEIIASQIPGFVPQVARPPGAPEPPDNAWIYVGYKVANGIVLWIFKRLGHLLIIGAVE